MSAPWHRLLLLVSLPVGAMLLNGCLKAEAQTAASTEVSRGKAYYTTCAGCHGNAGEGLRGMNAPRLAGLPAAYVASQLAHFRRGLRGGAEDFYGVAMNGRAKALGDDKAVADVSAFVATLPTPRAEVPHAGGDPANGRAIFATCAACHGAKGEGNVAIRAPVLAGSADWYVARQLANFKSGVRGRDGDDQGAQMRAAAQMLPDAKAMQDVAAYIATLR